jgi:hypothetical protein
MSGVVDTAFAQSLSSFRTSASKWLKFMLAHGLPGLACWTHLIKPSVDEIEHLSTFFSKNKVGVQAAIESRIADFDRFCERANQALQYTLQMEVIELVFVKFLQDNFVGDTPVHSACVQTLCKELQTLGPKSIRVGDSMQSVVTRSERCLRLFRVERLSRFDKAEVVTALIPEIQQCYVFEWFGAIANEKLRGLYDVDLWIRLGDGRYDEMKRLVTNGWPQECIDVLADETVERHCHHFLRTDRVQVINGLVSSFNRILKVTHEFPNLSELLRNRTNTAFVVPPEWETFLQSKNALGLCPPVLLTAADDVFGVNRRSRHLLAFAALVFRYYQYGGVGFSFTDLPLEKVLEDQEFSSGATAWMANQ